MDQNQPITTKRRDLLNLRKKACVSWEVCYIVWMEAKNINNSCIFNLQWPGMLLQSAAIVAKKLWVDDKITALSKKYVSWVLYAKF